MVAPWRDSTFGLCVAHTQLHSAHLDAQGPAPDATVRLGCGIQAAMALLGIGARWAIRVPQLRPSPTARPGAGNLATPRGANTMSEKLTKREAAYQTVGPSSPAT